MTWLNSNHETAHETISRIMNWPDSSQTTRWLMKRLGELWNNPTHVKPWYESWNDWSNCEMTQLMSNQETIRETISRTVKSPNSRQTTRSLMKRLGELWTDPTHIKPRDESWNDWSNYEITRLKSNHETTHETISRIVKWPNSCQTTRRFVKRLVELWNDLNQVEPREDSWNN